MLKANITLEVLNLAPLFASKFAAKTTMASITEDDLFFYSPTKLPRNTSASYTASLFSSITDSTILKHKKLLEAQGWIFYAVEQERGRCYYLDRRITIPVWAITSRSTAYLEWYISHEMAHAFAGHKAKHGDYFMAWLKAICPVASIHFETNYKPRNAAMNGISRSKEVNILRDAVANLTDADFL